MVHSDVVFDPTLYIMCPVYPQPALPQVDKPDGGEVAPVHQPHPALLPRQRPQPLTELVRQV